MLIKKELLNIQCMPFREKDKPTIPEVAKAPLVANVQVVDTLKCGTILAIDIYERRGAHRLVGRYFCDSQNDISYLTLHDRWSSDRMATLFDTTTSTENNLRLAKKYLLETPGGKSCYWWSNDKDVCRHIDQLKASRSCHKRQEYNERVVQRREALFSTLPKYPAELEAFLENVVFKPNYAFISKITAGKRAAVCSHCGRHFDVAKDKKHRSTSICPSCGRSLVCYADWYSTGAISDKATVVMAQTTTDGFPLLRYTKVFRSFQSGKVRYIYDDVSRVFKLPVQNRQRYYAFNMRYIPWYGWDWTRRIDELPRNSAYVLSDGLDTVFKLQMRNGFSLEKALSHIDQAICLEELLHKLITIPADEYLLQMGMVRLACTITPKEIDASGRTFASTLGVNGQYMRLYRKYDVDIDEHRIIKHYSESGRFVHEQSFQAFRELCTSSSSNLRTYNLNEVLDRMTMERFVSYFDKQMKISHKSLNALCGFYRDYCDLMTSLGIDSDKKGVRFPRDLVDAHDRLVIRYNKIKHELEDERLAYASGLLERGIPNFTRDGLTVRIPESREDFIREGTALSHCVGQERYVQGHISGERMIFFIRRDQEPDKPYFTMEVDMKRMVILQLYGYSDCMAPKEVREFAVKFIKKITPKTGKKVTAVCA